MSFRAGTVSVAISLLAVSLPISAETVATKEQRFFIKYADGIEWYLARWTAVAEFAWNESGGPAEPFKGKFTDDRRCSWSANGHIERAVFLVGRGSTLTEDPTKHRVYSTDSANEGSSFVLSALRPENCNDARDRRESDFANTRAHLRNALAGIAAADLGTLPREYASAVGTVVTAPAVVDGLCYGGDWGEDAPNKPRWTFTLSNQFLTIRRKDGFATGEFQHAGDGWAGHVRWGNGEDWNGVTLSSATAACDEIRTNQIWYFKR